MEDRPHPLLRVDVDLAIVPVDYVLGDREAKAGAGLAALGGAVFLGEAGEQAAAELG